MASLQRRPTGETEPNKTLTIVGGVRRLHLESLGRLLAGVRAADGGAGAAAVLAGALVLRGHLKVKWAGRVERRVAAAQLLLLLDIVWVVVLLRLLLRLLLLLL